MRPVLLLTCREGVGRAAVYGVGKRREGALSQHELSTDMPRRAVAMVRALSLGPDTSWKENDVPAQ